jgi:hypothetical protein
VTTIRYEISPSLDVWAVKDKAEKIAARAASKGLSGGYAVSIESEHSEAVDPLTGLSKAVVREFLVIEGEPVKIDGWTFVASVEYVNGDPVVTGSPYYEGQQVDRTALRPNWCDHCQTERFRTHYIVVEDQAGVRKVVGSTCVKDFLGHSLSLSFFKDPFDGIEDSLSGSGFGGRSLDRIDSALALAACVIRQAGFVKSDSGSDSTKSHVADLLGWYGPKAYAAAVDQFDWATDADVAVAREALEFGRTMTGTSDYVLNLQAVLKGEHFDGKYLGLIVSLVGVYLHAEEKERERKAAPQITEAPFAEAGTKFDKVIVTVTGSTEVYNAYKSGYYGDVYDTRWTFVTVDEPHYRLSWKTGSAVDFAVGDTIELKGTVKDANPWTNDKGVTYTTTRVLRCKARVLETTEGKV